jgi:hypothetical protein
MNIHLKNISAQVGGICDPERNFLSGGLDAGARLDFVRLVAAKVAHRSHNYHFFEVGNILKRFL